MVHAATDLMATEAQVVVAADSVAATVAHALKAVVAVDSVAAIAAHVLKAVVAVALLAETEAHVLMAAHLDPSPPAAVIVAHVLLAQVDQDPAELQVETQAVTPQLKLQNLPQLKIQPDAAT